ncbi:MAG: hypothetical protein IT236_13025 [Bacteroidia bacterium]|nr:hypothetical protein [Bacteroidia bacterium]
MELLDKVKKFENLHIVFWLIKDTCWMLEVKWLGALMVLPTIGVAFYIILQTFKTREVYVNLAILFWISANSFWMCMEFFNNNHYKNFAAIPFALGFIFVGIYYFKGLAKSMPDTSKS